MIKHSKQQARQRGLLRKSQEHGKDEWKCVIAEEFKLKNKLESSMKQAGGMEMEAGYTSMYMYI